jgi:hypothetical protein
MHGRQFAGAAERAARWLVKIDERRPLCDLRFAHVVNAQVEFDLAVAAVESHGLVCFHGGLVFRGTRQPFMRQRCTRSRAWRGLASGDHALTDDEPLF